MLIATACPACGNTLKAPNHLLGKQVKCLRCNKLFTLSAAPQSEAVTTGPAAKGATAKRTPSLVSKGPGGAILAAFCLGFLSLALGTTAGVMGFFAATAGYSKLLAWLGIAAGAVAVTLALVHEDAGFVFPYGGACISVLSLTLMVFWLGQAPRNRGPFGGFPGGGPPGGGGPGMGQGGGGNWQGGRGGGNWQGGRGGGNGQGGRRGGGNRGPNAGGAGNPGGPGGQGAQAPPGGGN
jgi:hypothetical protein